MDFVSSKDLPHPDSPSARLSSVAVSTDTQDAAKPSAFLDKFTSGIGDYSAEELNNALITVFGELSADPHPQVDDEARAIASTILNRRTAILKARQQYDQAVKERSKAKVLAEESKTRLQGMATSSASKAEIAAAKQAAVKAQKAFNDTGVKLQQASDAKRSNELYVDGERRGDPGITLTDIVDAGEKKTDAPLARHSDPGIQYVGHKQGRMYYDRYPLASAWEKKQFLRRWEIAKKALDEVVRDPSTCYSFMGFFSSNGGKRILKPGEIRIGGNDFH